MADLGGVAGLQLVVRVIFERVISSTQMPQNRNFFLSRSAFPIGNGQNSDFFADFWPKLLLLKESPIEVWPNWCRILSERGLLEAGEAHPSVRATTAPRSRRVFAQD